MKFSFCKKYLFQTISLLLLSIGPCFLYGEQGVDDLWDKISPLVEKDSSDSTLQVVNLLIKGQCEDDHECLFNIKSKLAHLLGTQFNVKECIEVNEEILALGKEHNNLDYIAHAHIELYRYYDLLGLHYIAIENLQNAAEAYEALGNKSSMYYCKFSKYESLLAFNGDESMIDSMYLLLAEVDSLGIARSARHMRLRLPHILIPRNRIKEAYAVVEALDTIALSNPYITDDYPVLLVRGIARAQLEVKAGNIEAAKNLYLQCQIYAIAEPSRWLEISILHELAKIEHKEGNIKKARAYLEESIQKAEELKLLEHLATSYQILTTFNEAEENYKGAYASHIASIDYQNRFEERGKDFDMKSFLLEKEKANLLVKSKNQDLELELKKNQIKNFYILLAFGLIGVLGIAYNYNRLKNSREELQKQNVLIRDQAESLKQLNDAKSQFFTNISHELRTPLTLIAGPIENLRNDDTLTAKQVKLLDLAHQNCDQLVELVNEILDLRKLDDGKMKLNLQPTSLATFFSTYFLQFESLAVRKNIAYQLHVDIDKNLQADIDNSKCRQIIYNLLSNAFKFTPSQGIIVAKVSLEKGQLLLSIANSGEDVDSIDEKNIFKRFYQGEAKPTGGSGVGLSLCYEYAKTF